MAQGGNEIDTSTADGPSRPVKQPQPPEPRKHGHDKGGDGNHEVPAPRERVDDEAYEGQKRMTRQE